MECEQLHRTRVSLASFPSLLCFFCVVDIGGKFIQISSLDYGENVCREHQYSHFFAQQADEIVLFCCSLKPNSKYMFRVAASNDMGLGPYSEASDQISTKPAAPDSPPLDVKVIPKTTTSVSVTWKVSHVSLLFILKVVAIERERDSSPFLGRPRRATFCLQS